MHVKAPVNARSATIKAVVTRANGTVENYGTVSYWHRNPVLNFLGNLAIKLKGVFHGRASTE